MNREVEDRRHQRAQNHNAVNDEDADNNEDLITIIFRTRIFQDRSITIHIQQQMCDVIADYRIQENGFLRSTELTYTIFEFGPVDADCTLTGDEYWLSGRH
jgi:hypothetical protein